MTSIQKHLDNIRPMAHKAQIRNGHYKKMAQLSVIARKKRVIKSDGEK